MDKLDMFQSRFGKIDQFGWWDLERISADAGTQFTSTDYKEEPHDALPIFVPRHKKSGCVKEK